MVRMQVVVHAHRGLVTDAGGIDLSHTPAHLIGDKAVDAHVHRCLLRFMYTIRLPVGTAKIADLACLYLVDQDRQYSLDRL